MNRPGSAPMRKLSPTNNIKLYCSSMGKVFMVRYIARDMEEANEYCRRNSDCGVIAEDGSGLIFIAELYAAKCTVEQLEGKP